MMRRPARRLARLLVPYALVIAGYVAARHEVLGALTIRTPPPLLDNPLAHVDVWPRLATAVVVLWQYVSVLALPLRLSADDSYDQVPVVTSALDPRFLVDDAKLDRIAALVEIYWPERIAPDQLGDSDLIGRIEAARAALLSTLDLPELA